MMNLDQEIFAAESSYMSTKKKEIFSSDMQRTSEWIFSQEMPSDIIVRVGGVSFSLHQFPLVSKSGYIRNLVSESSDAHLSVIEIPEDVGGAEALELAAKFCYGRNFEISIRNIGMLRCIAEFLEMTEDYAAENLVKKTEDYLNEVALQSLSGAISVLHQCEKMLQLAEEMKLVSRCIDAIAFMACNESLFAVKGKDESFLEGIISSSVSLPKPVVDWWAEDLTVLRIDMFQRVINAMIARGFKQFALGPILMLYAQQSLRGLEIYGKGKKNMELRQEHEKRIVLETLVSLLPRVKKAISVSFLSMLLRAAIYLETTVACRLDLEKRMSSQLVNATLDDLLIPSYSIGDGTLFDVDTVIRIMSNYLEHEMEGNNNRDLESVYPSSDLQRVGELMENYLAEIASDENLYVLKFINLAELIPAQARETEDVMYRAIDIYFKAHPSLSDMERKKICSLLDCQKLSRQACAHAAQNDRLPAQIVVQVLYYEQHRLQNDNDPALPSKLSLHKADIHQTPDDLSTLKRENDDLKIELAKMKMKFKDVEKSTAKKLIGSSPLIHPTVAPPADKPPLHRKSFLNSVSKRLGRLYSFLRADGVSASSAEGQANVRKNRRHSIS